MTKTISNDLALSIAHAHREIKTAQELLDKIEKATSASEIERQDIRDVFGRKINGLQLGVRSGETSQTLFDVPWTMAKPIIKAHIAAQQSLIEALSLQALAEMTSGKEIE